MAEIVVTFKGMGEKPWIVVHADSVKEQRELMDQIDQEFLDHVRGTATTYDTHVPTSAGQLVEQHLGGVEMAPQGQPTTTPYAQPAPMYQQPPQAATMGARMCQHGAMVLKEGRSSRGPWSAWMCQWGDKSTQCQPVDAITGKEWPKR